MQPKHNTLLGTLFVLALPLAFSFTPRREKPAAKAPAPKIQVAILLDVSNSMDGLIDQAKAQLWNLVGLLGRAECDRGTAQVEIALYEYGRSSDDAGKGYVKRIHSFTRELDSLSKSLFALTTNGGEEYCPQVIYTSVQDLPWDNDPKTYKALFIAGNESFRQGTLSWEKACEAARAKGVVVNTIYCGDKTEGTNLYWNLGAECGTGSYSNINSNAKVEDIPTPYDSILYTLNSQFNVTIVGYGLRGRAAGLQVAEVDKMNYEHNKASGAARTAVKAKKGLYNNATWDMVDAFDVDSNFYKNVDRATLPDSLQHKSAAELRALIERKHTEREAVRSQIGEVSRKREDWLADERKRRAAAAGGAQQATLETEMEKVLKVQVQRNGFTIK